MWHERQRRQLHCRQVLGLPGQSAKHARPDKLNLTRIRLPQSTCSFQRCVRVFRAQYYGGNYTASLGSWCVAHSTVSELSP